ncbi:MAG: hypothetical protein ACLFWD_00625 [Anaerolineales bacterium]
MPETLEFYDVKTRTKFQSADWRIEVKEKNNTKRYFAVTKAPAGTHEAWRIVSKDFAQKNM